MTTTEAHPPQHGPLLGAIVRCARSFYRLLGNRRKFERMPIAGKVELTSNGSAVINRQICACVDISPRGIGLDCPEAIEPESIVELRSEENGSTRLARVRYCRENGAGRRIGLEFLTDTDRPW